MFLAFSAFPHRIRVIWYLSICTKSDVLFFHCHLVISDLGWYDSESYGIAYKVRGFCKDLSNPEIFDEVNVRGDILRSHIHHLYFGHYSYGHQGGNFSYNEVN